MKYIRFLDKLVKDMDRENNAPYGSSERNAVDCGPDESQGDSPGVEKTATLGQLS